MEKCLESCPDGWNGDGNTCKAPSHYSGPANKTSHFGGWSQSRRLNWAKDAQVTWTPCTG